MQLQPMAAISECITKMQANTGYAGAAIKPEYQNFRKDYLDTERAVQDELRRAAIDKVWLGYRSRRGQCNRHYLSYCQV